ncbi:hypothetical protein ACIP2X_31195 [Streptomyces sp. NPDC089424]|uniref:hypothetical protein n=1 Tax=Streptomyces sp. NPDC089424 TaxID=3365917 RepID=UPI0037F464F1
MVTTEWPGIRPVLEDVRREGGTEAMRTAIDGRGEALNARTRAMLSGAGALHGYLDHRVRVGP